VHRLLAAQLAATGEDFHRDVSRIGLKRRGMAADANEILRLRDHAFGPRRDGAEGGFLRGLESSVGQALGLVDDIDGRRTGGRGGQPLGRRSART
jgi:hypothetical protein